MTTGWGERVGPLGGSWGLSSTLEGSSATNIDGGTGVSLGSGFFLRLHVVQNDRHMG